jgi:hypothetical protein
MAGMCIELSGKCGSCRKKVKEGVMIVIGGSIGNVPIPLKVM